MHGSPPPARRPWYHPRRLIERLMLYLVVGYVVICAFLYVMQTRLVYIGMGGGSLDQAVQLAAGEGLAPWKLDGQVVGFVRSDFRDAAPRGTFVLCHGNGEQAWQDGYLADALRARGFRTVLYEYPGYSGRPGSPSERTIVPEVQALVRELDREGLGPVYLWGQSLGSGVVAAACADATLPVHGLILVWPFDSLPNAAQMHYPIIPVHWLMTDRYNSAANLKAFAHPICVMRSEFDTVVPPVRTLSLFAQLPEPKKMMVFSGLEHSEFPASGLFWDEALDFVAPK